VKKISLDLPTLFGDHHVTEVRRLLLELPGVVEVYASSSFQIVEVEFDETKLAPEQFNEVLEKAGYLGELSIPVEKGAIEKQGNGDKPFFRQSAFYEQAGKDVSFAQKVPYAGRPLWPCPGMGPLVQLEMKEKEEKSYG
jgi:copper chaperone CopZ